MDEMLNVASVPAISACVYWTINILKHITKNDEKVLRFVPVFAALFGIMYGALCWAVYPAIMPTANLLSACVMGAASGLTATGFHQIIKQQTK